MVLKAAPETALDALVFAEAADEAGLPPTLHQRRDGGEQSCGPPQRVDVADDRQSV
ncbi:hypothetical protein [Mycolicibacterium diernhoferi]|uniref:hypothetical protein n=1 Tax=Mycolicibacterium diernhoferi TaxID=1801 RepID=UPI0013F5B596|nr:hypothetical protein [Mycolicibacterium diernhoferi]QYL25015.1 hypothetical protein K0O62_12645 [Mycolicibacterium diernhoferi]